MIILLIEHSLHDALKSSLRPIEYMPTHATTTKSQTGLTYKHYAFRTAEEDKVMAEYYPLVQQYLQQQNTQQQPITQACCTVLPNACVSCCRL